MVGAGGKSADNSKRADGGFQELAEHNFIDSVVNELLTGHAETVQNVTEHKLYKRVVYGIGRAREYGLTWENNIATYVILMFEIAPDFDRFPVLHKYLTDDSIPPDERMYVLLNKTTEAIGRMRGKPLLHQTIGRKIMR